MDQEYWQKQEKGKPLYPDILWSQPVNKTLAGKLAIIGGDAQGFSSVSSAYAAAEKAGIGVSRVLVPDSLKKTLKSWPECEFAPSTLSGSFAASSLASWIDLADWADGVLISGGLGKNSETSILFEKFLEKNARPLTLCGESIDHLISFPFTSLNLNNLLIALELNKLQKLLSAVRFPMAVKSDISLMALVSLLHSFTQSYPLAVITRHEQYILAATGGKISTTKVDQNKGIDQSATYAGVWWLQHQSKRFEAISSGIYSLAS